MAPKTKLKVDFFQKYANDSQSKIKGDEFCDVTLVSEDSKQIKAHKVIIASASLVFREMLKNNIHAHPLIFMRGVTRNVLVSLIDFIYSGETYLESENMEDFMKLIAEIDLYPAQQDKTVQIINSPELDTNEVKTNRKICKFWNRGFCKEGAECQLYHSKEDCEKHITYET